MFKKYYKEANDDIKTNRQLIDKIFEEAEKPTKTKHFAKIYKFGMAAAAVLVLAVSVSLLPTIMKGSGQQNVANPTSPIAQSQTNISDEDANSANETDESTEETNAKTEEKVQPIKPVETEKKDNTSEDTPILAMETGESQGFAIPRGRMSEEPQENSEHSVSVDEWQEPSQAEVDMIARFFVDKYGEKDLDTGFDYGFYTEGKAEVEGETLYFVRMSLLVDNNHWSLLQNFVVNESMTELYYSVIVDGNEVYWRTSENLVAQ